MSIADKLTQIIENLPKVYEAGQKSIQNIEYVNTTISGKIERADYVSEVPHKVEVKFSSDTIQWNCRY